MACSQAYYTLGKFLSYYLRVILETDLLDAEYF